MLPGIRAFHTGLSDLTLTKGQMTMTKSRNSFTRPFTICRNALVDINVISCKAASIISKELAELTTKRQSAEIYLVSGYFMRDDIRPRNYTGQRFDTNAEMRPLINETGRRFQAHCLTLAFEAIEKFLKRLGSDLLWRKRITPHPGDIERFERNRSLNSRNKTYWTTFVKDCLCQSNTDELVKLMKRDISDLSGTAQPYVSSKSKPFVPPKDLFHMFRLVTICRHLTVHDGKVNVKALANKTQTPVQDIRNLSRVSCLNRKRIIMPDRDTTKKYLELLADFAFVLYRTASEACALPIEWEPYLSGTPTKAPANLLQLNQELLNQLKKKKKKRKSKKPTNQ